MVTSAKTASVREAILQAAAETMAAAGSGAVRVDDVARLAGANKRMIYHYFGDRAGLVQSVIASRLRALHNAPELNDDAKHALSRIAGDPVVTGVDDQTTDVPLRQAAVILLSHCLLSGYEHDRQSLRGWNLEDSGSARRGLQQLLALAMGQEPKPRYRLRSASRPASSDQLF